MEIDSLEEVRNTLSSQIYTGHNIFYKDLTFASEIIVAMAYTS
jgi:hypothetical protein